MNKVILHPEVQQYIADNLTAEITKIILKGSPFDEVSIQELANQIIAKQKSKQKLSTWFNSKNIYYPERISIEQTSSEIAAKYKSDLVSGDAIIDITGGFGIDSFYFSRQFKKVVHCEINKVLSAIAKHNFKQLNVSNTHFYAVNGFDFLKKTEETFDCIYIDPSRRNDIKGKVFLLKDCLPNIPPKLDFFFTKANQILIKVSPILDISNTINELKYVKEIHVVAINNEVKETLFFLEKGFENNIQIKTVNYQKKREQVFNFIWNKKETSNYAKPLNYIYEPNAAILKAGGFHQISTQLSIFKLHQHSHLYTSKLLIDFPGRVFIVNKVVAYHPKKIKKILQLKKANITTRNFPKTVAQIRKETKIKDGGNTYLFFTVDEKNNKIVIISEKI